ncbi:MAG: HAD domain-containing protein [Oscillospiraceae bacterium]
MHIFLDFDGVLHPDAVYAPRNKPIELRAKGELFMHAHVLIEALAPYPEAKIVLSTSWVRAFGYSRTIKKMPPALASRVIGATYHTDMKDQSPMYGSGYDSFQGLSRYQQIINHVNRNAIKNWFAIDDLHSGTEIHEWPKDMRHYLLLTEEQEGLATDHKIAELNTKLMSIQYD